MNEQQIKELADSMNVSVTDLMCLAQSVVIGINQDGAKDSFLAMNDSDKVETTSAYVAHSVRKMNQFVSTYLTNPEARELVHTNVLALM